MPRHPHRALASGRPAVVALLVLVLVVGLGLAGLRLRAGNDVADAVDGSPLPAAASTSPRSDSPGSPGSPDAPDPTAEVVEAAPAPRVGSVVPESPRSVVLPSGVLVPVVAVPTRADGVLDVPSDIDTAGWWEGGSRLGDPFGSTLLAAHVDAVEEGLGPYAELLSARPGQRVTLRSAHLVQQFRIRSLRLVPQGSLADQSRIFSPDGALRLTLVTCAPPYVRSRGGYQNLAVVVAVPVGPVREKGSR